MNEKTKKWKLIVAGLMAGMLLGGTIAITTPSVAAGPAKVWKQIKKKTDKRYYTKKKSNKLYAAKPTTIRGTYALSIQPSVVTYGVTGISFGMTLPGNPVAHYIKLGDAVPSECAGGSAALPQAAAGHLCVFEGYQTGANDRGVTTVGYIGTSDANRMGAIMFGSSSGAAVVRIMGGWAVGTGPTADWRRAPKPDARPGS